MELSLASVVLGLKFIQPFTLQGRYFGMSVAFLRNKVLYGYHHRLQTTDILEPHLALTELTYDVTFKSVSRKSFESDLMEDACELEVQLMHHDLFEIKNNVYHDHSILVMDKDQYVYVLQSLPESSKSSSASLKLEWLTFQEEMYQKFNTIHLKFYHFRTKTYKIDVTKVFHEQFFRYWKTCFPEIYHICDSSCKLKMMSILQYLKFELSKDFFQLMEKDVISITPSNLEDIYYMDRISETFHLASGNPYRKQLKENRNKKDKRLTEIEVFLSLRKSTRGIKQKIKRRIKEWILYSQDLLTFTTHLEIFNHFRMILNIAKRENIKTKRYQILLDLILKLVSDPKNHDTEVLLKIFEILDTLEGLVETNLSKPIWSLMIHLLRRLNDRGILTQKNNQENIKWTLDFLDLMDIWSR